MERVTMKQRLKWIPMYAVVPALSLIILNIFAYYGTRLLTGGSLEDNFNLTLALDRAIPFVPQAIVIYIGAFVSWFVGFFVIARDSKEVCYEVYAGEFTAKFISMVIFLVMPTVMIRPEVPDGGFFSWLTRFIYATDTPDNLFPSLHCLESWIIFRGAMRCRRVGNGYRISMFVIALLVFASTLLVKQHVVLDVVGGVVVGELGLWLARRLRFGRMYEALERKWSL